MIKVTVITRATREFPKFLGYQSESILLGSHQLTAYYRFSHLNKINETSGQPLPPFQWCQNGAFFLPRAFIIALGGCGNIVPLYFVQDCSSLRLSAHEHERARWIKSFLVIGYPRGEDGAVLSARDYPPCLARKLSPNLCNKSLLTKFVLSRWLDLSMNRRDES